MKQRLFTLFTGMVLGMMLLSGSYAAANTILTASPTSQTFYVNSQQVQFEAYEIHGNNFVKLRDIGKIVDFGVTYDGVTNTVHIAPDSHYIEEVTTPAPATPASSVTPADSYTISTDHWSREDFSQRANPAVFTGVYDRALYNTTWLEHYVPQNFTNYWQYLDYFAVTINVLEQYEAALDYIQPAITQASQLGSDRAKVEYLHDYLCSLLAYDLNAVADIAQIFSPHDIEMKGACGDYVRAFNYLCSAANLPSFTVRSTDHSWNLVYADGRWLYVDVSADDLRQNKDALLLESYPRHTDIAPEATAFIKELLVPGSTK